LVKLLERAEEEEKHAKTERSSPNKQQLKEAVAEEQYQIEG
jgi:hypothetical protein